MTAEITPLIAGNWKMNGTTAALGEVQKLAGLLAAGGGPRCTVVICPPATLLERLNELAAPAGIVSGGQDCHPAANGAHTGDISAQMLADAGAQYVIVGHSERRIAHRESDADAAGKVRAVHDAGHRGTDGCSIPTYAVPLKSFAHGFARMATGQGLGQKRAAAAKRRALRSCRASRSDTDCRTSARL